MNLSDVTVLIINRKTLHLTRACLESLFQFYPDIHVLLVDNRSDGDPSEQWIRDISQIYSNVTPYMIVQGEPHHALGLNTAFSICTTPYIISLDSDVTVLRGEWIEAMSQAFLVDPFLFAIGQLALNSNSDCTRAPFPGEKSYAFVSPFCAMWDVTKFRQMKVAFDFGGQPACTPCRAAIRSGYHLANLPGLHPNNLPNGNVQPYVYHEWGGTRHRLMVLEDWERQQKGNK